MNAGVDPSRRGAVVRCWNTALAVLLSALAAACTGSVANSPSLVETRTSLLDQTPDVWVAGASKERVSPTGGPVVGEEPLATDWWNEFGDPQLDALVAETLAQNHDLKAAAARVGRAAAQARVQGADLYPSLRLGDNAARSRQVYVGLPIPQEAGAPSVLSNTYNQFGLSLDLSWEIDLWGRLRAADAAAGAEAEAASILYDGARLSLAGQTAKIWFAVVEAAAQVALAQSTVETYRDGADQVRSRYERGVRTPLDLRLALTQVAAAEARVAERQSLLERAARQLEILLGRYPSAELAKTGAREGTVLSDAEPAAIPLGVPAELLARRPDLAAAAQKVYAADQKVYAAKAALLPRIALTGRAGTVSDDVADLLDGDFGVWTIASNMVQPLFEGGRLRAGISGAKAEADQAQAEYATTALQAFAEVENALADERHVTAVVTALDVAAQQSAAAERLAGQRYRGGLEDYVTVLAAQRSSLDAKATLLAAKRRRLENRVDLHLALGGGFADPAVVPAEAPTAASAVPPLAAPASSTESPS